MKIQFVICSIWLLSHVDCWTPVTNPAAYTVHQTFADRDSKAISRSSSSNFLASDSVDTLLDSFNKNVYTDDVSESVIGFLLRLSHEVISHFFGSFSNQFQFS